MRILFVVPYTPNLIRVRPYNLIRSLAGRGHEVTLLTLTTNEAEESEAQAMERYCCRVIAHPLPRWRSLWNAASALPQGFPLQSSYCWQPALATAMRKLLDQQRGGSSFDVAHVEHLRGARYALRLTEQSGNNRLPIVWDSVDCISALFKQAASESRSLFGRWMTRFELDRTEQYEAWLIRQFERVLVTSPADRSALLSLLPRGTTPVAIDVLPNGVDLQYFTPSSVTRDPATIVISGKMSYHANVTMTLHLVETIMPAVWAQRPDARLVVVGKDPPREIRLLAEQLPITVTGTVDDIRPYLRQATIAVAPLTYGAGIQNKVLEAMACETAVISSGQAVRALAAKPGRELLVADTPQAFTAAILRLLDRPEERDALARAGLKYVRTYHDWDTIAAQLEGLYQRAMLSTGTG